MPWLPVWESLSISSSLTAVDVVKIKAPKLYELGVNETLGTREGMEAFFGSITSIVKFFAAGWDEGMLEETARFAYEEYNWLTVAELKLFTTRVKVGKYPRNKNFNPGIYMECLTEFAYEIKRARETKPTVFTQMVIEQPADPEAVKLALKTAIDNMMNIEARMLAEQEQERKAKWQGLKNQRDQQIIALVERDATQGIAPEKPLMDLYFAALSRLAGK